MCSEQHRTTQAIVIYRSLECGQVFIEAVGGECPCIYSWPCLLRLVHTDHFARCGVQLLRDHVELVHDAMVYVTGGHTGSIVLAKLADVHSTITDKHRRRQTPSLFDFMILTQRPWTARTCLRDKRDKV